VTASPAPGHLEGKVKLFSWRAPHLREHLVGSVHALLTGQVSALRAERRDHYQIDAVFMGQCLREARIARDRRIAQKAIQIGVLPPRTSSIGALGSFAFDHGARVGQAVSAPQENNRRRDGRGATSCMPSFATSIVPLLRTNSFPVVEPAEARSHRVRIQS
jgi:hypothetical protein